MAQFFCDCHHQHLVGVPVKYCYSYTVSKVLLCPLTELKNCFVFKSHSLMKRSFPPKNQTQFRQDHHEWLFDPTRAPSPCLMLILLLHHKAHCVMWRAQKKWNWCNDQILGNSKQSIWYATGFCGSIFKGLTRAAVNNRDLAVHLSYARQHLFTSQFNI